MRRRQLIILGRVTLLCLVIVLWVTADSHAVDSGMLLRDVASGLALGLLMTMLLWWRQLRAVRRLCPTPSSADFDLRQRREVLVPLQREQALRMTHDALRLLPHLSILEPVGTETRVVARSWVVRFWRRMTVGTGIAFVVGVVVGNIWFLQAFLFWLIPALSLSEKVIVEFEQRSDFETMVTISSRPHSPLATVDYGRNLANVEWISNYLRSAG